MVRVAIKDVADPVPRVGYADSAGLCDKGDALHFSADAQDQLGTRYAEARRELQESPPHS